MTDSNIIIFRLKQHEIVNQKLKETKNVPKSNSVITCDELEYGARDPRHVERNLAVSYRIAEIFPIINIDKSSIGNFGEIKNGLEKKWKYY